MRLDGNFALDPARFNTKIIGYRKVIRLLLSQPYFIPQKPVEYDTKEIPFGNFVRGVIDFAFSDKSLPPGRS